MKTLKEKRIETLNDKLEPSKEGLYFGEDVKECFKEILSKMEKIKNKHFEDISQEVPKRNYKYNIGSYYTISYFMRFIKNKSGFDK